MTDFWVYFEARPLWWIIVTIATFIFTSWLNRRVGGTPLLHPVLVALTLIIVLLRLTGTDYETYFDGAQFIHFMLGPATVALAIPLYDHFERVKKMLLPLLIACCVGAVTASLSVVAVAWALGASEGTVLSLAPKSVTSPIAIGIAEKIGGYPSLAAGLVLITGAIGCLTAPVIFRVLKVNDDAVRGFTLGLSSHGFGTAFAFEFSSLAGAFAGLAMGMTGLMTAFLVPLLVRLLGLG
ncbi:LrgB family protein [Marinobacterium sp. AK62]|uniref:LrgB family protein n=1 Tax=Marinobacterium alkalitolerans TaxID=1542925 RepID=A0ABS3Z6M2_9GAMM|nr:LrgB family protein [Marinobacterium alkalitolerans]MBP0047359.1 LrgB family protein [Marinobacterium alkalitolerans]